MTSEEIVAIVETAVARFADEHFQLLELDVNEQTIAQHIATYIAQAVRAPLSVDVEYNRHLNEKKVVLIDGPGEGGLHAVVRPDIVVHERGTDRQNVVALEVKKLGNDLAYDEQKLRALRKQYGYMCAAHVIVGLKEGRAACAVVWIDL